MLSQGFPLSVEELAALGIPTWAAALGEGSLPLSTVPLAAPVAVVVGNEGSGVTEQTQSLCAGHTCFLLRGWARRLRRGSARVSGRQPARDRR